MKCEECNRIVDRTVRVQMDTAPGEPLLNMIITKNICVGCLIGDRL